jgi:hypothetical protein
LRLAAAAHFGAAQPLRACGGPPGGLRRLQGPRDGKLPTRAAAAAASSTALPACHASFIFFEFEAKGRWYGMDVAACGQQQALCLDGMRERGRDFEEQKDDAMDVAARARAPAGAVSRWYARARARFGHEHLGFRRAERTMAQDVAASARAAAGCSCLGGMRERGRGSGTSISRCPATGAAIDS